MGPGSSLATRANARPASLSGTTAIWLRNPIVKQPKGMLPQSRGADASECRCKPPSLSKEGAGNAGCWPPPWPACKTKSRRQLPQVQPKHPAFPARWLDDLLRTLPGEPGLFAPVVSEIISRDLTPASGCQDHTTWSYASAPFVRTKKRARRQSVHRIPVSRPRDDRASVPLPSRRDTGRGSYFSEKLKKNIFRASTGQRNRP